MKRQGAVALPAEAATLPGSAFAGCDRVEDFPLRKWRAPQVSRLILSSLETVPDAFSVGPPCGACRFFIATKHSFRYSKLQTRIAAGTACATKILETRGVRMELSLGNTAMEPHLFRHKARGRQR